MHFQNFIFFNKMTVKILQACIEFTHSNEALPIIKEINTLLKFGIWP